jgi:mRNA-degrading endonuclease RelE of RelBE toxin-antitoxin system
MLFFIMIIIMTSIREFPRYTIAENSEIYDTLNKRVIKQSNSNGYKIVSLVNEEGNQKCPRIHRLVFETFVLKDGETMPKEIDHIDNNRSNNQIANLRAATHQENLRNQQKRKDNTSGYKNIYITKSGTYRVQIRISKDDRYIKTFKTLQEAIDDSIRIMDEHHRDFARHS